MKLFKNIKSITTITVLLVLLTGSACHHRCIRGNGNVSTEQRSETNFNSIEVSSALKVIYTQSNEYKVEVVADDNLVGYITTEVSGGELKIGIKNKRCFNKITRADILVSAPTLNSIKLSGASTFETTNQLNTSSVKMELSGASKLTSSGKMNSLTANISGASSIDVSGSSGTLNIEASGASSFNSAYMNSNIANINFSGASSGSVKVKNNLNATLSGSSSLYYSGNPSVTSNLSGSSSLNKN